MRRADTRILASFGEYLPLADTNIKQRHMNNCESFRVNTKAPRIRGE